MCVYKILLETGIYIIFSFVQTHLPTLMFDSGKENVEGRGERQQHENSPLSKDVSGEERKEDTSSGKVNTLSEEAKTLQEIADILLLLKQREMEELFDPTEDR